jgi:hypothetical protein
MPEFLGGRSLRVEPIDLPAEVVYPGLKAFIRREEIARREAAIAQAALALARSSKGVKDAEGASCAAAESARLALRLDEAQHAFALSDLAALRARIAADDVRFGRSAGDVATLSRSASRAERQASCDRAAVELAQAEQALADARKKSPNEVARAEHKRSVALMAQERARAALDKDAPTDARHAPLAWLGRALRVRVDKHLADYRPLSLVYPAKSTGRRAALARWITDRSNPLTARVAVNHIWRWHFGTPLVATTYDFGRNGATPTHPELLDWLAVELVEPTAPGAVPWSLKALHRRIVTSAAYRMASHPSRADHPARAIDPANRCYWQFPASRMEAEEVRDSLLRVAGVLDPTPGGPDIDHSLGLTSRRRSLYFTHHGESRMPFLELFDAPDACEAYRRTTTVVPQQALALVNNELLLELSGGLAARLWSETAAAGEPRRVEGFVTAAFEQILSRPPAPGERALAGEFLARQAALLEGAVGRTAAGPGPDADPHARARRDLVHALFSHNDFLTVH